MDLISGLKIDMMNVNGINNPQKQKRCITYFNSIYSDIIVLIDTRLKENTEQSFKNTTNAYDIYSTLSDGPTTRRGVSILYKYKKDTQRFKRQQLPHDRNGTIWGASLNNRSLRT